MAPRMMSAGAAPVETWLITSDSAKTAHTPEMGTGDFEVAVEEGATHIRIGTALVGGIAPSGR